MLDECNSEERISCPRVKNRRINTLGKKIENRKINVNPPLLQQ